MRISIDLCGPLVIKPPLNHHYCGKSPFFTTIWDKIFFVDFFHLHLKVLTQVDVSQSKSFFLGEHPLFRQDGQDARITTMDDMIFWIRGSLYYNLHFSLLY